MTMTWRERIQAARERGRFTPYDRDDASEYCSCAVGETVEKYGVSRGGFVCDKGSLFSAQAVGVRFYRAVKANSFDEAEALLDAIEDRGVELKREMSA